ncbi:MAG: hypothetical protein KAR13_15750 [Desulfobulbaceae bacterium]|nr:hypothetical protein [Desulfobulbaceae bacterium]
MVKIWEQFRKQQPKAKQLSAIIPIVLYHVAINGRYLPIFPNLNKPAMFQRKFYARSKQHCGK